LVARQTGIIDELYQDKTPENLSKFQNVQELLNAIQDFSINALEEGRPNRLENYLEEIALISDLDNEKEEDRNKVTLMTIHSAKGLEFKNVFIVGLEEKLFPSSFSGVITPESLEEERRLFYVALTRAMKNAWLSFAKQRYSWGQLNFCEPSRFIEEIDESFLIQPSNQRIPSFFDQPSSHSFFQEREVRKNDIQSFPPRRQATESVTPPMSKRLSSIKQAMARPTFEADDPNKIIEGAIVEHQRFGLGKVLKMEGNDANRKATVLFENAGRKELLLKFAKLKVVE
jgi:DNA helicase II / ATP-dependent DNA helicase PcrA